MFTKQQFVDFHASAVQKMTEIMRAKNADYTGSSASPFANFTQVENNGICTTEQGILVRMTDKMSRINSLLDRDAQVKDESIEDTLLDLANYSIILAGYIRSKRQSIPVDLPTVQPGMSEAEIKRYEDYCAIYGR